MFSDFDKAKKHSEGRGRMGVSLALSAVVYVLIAGGLAAAIATARAVVVKKEREVAVEFATLPTQPEIKKKPPKPKVKKPEAKKPDADPGEKRNLDAPTSIPDQALAEASSGRLSDAEKLEIDKMIGGGGKKGPRQKKEKVSRPKYLSGCRAPEIPDEVRKKAETIRVRVRMLVMPDGVPMKAEMEKSHPAIPDESIIHCAMAQRFEPARLPDGTAVPYPYRRQFTFKPANI